MFCSIFPRLDKKFYFLHTARKEIQMVALVLITLAFGLINYEFFNQANKEIEPGARWHYVGPQSLDPRAKSIPMQETPDGKSFIVWKLKVDK